MDEVVITDWPGLGRYVELRETDDPLSALEAETLLSRMGRNGAPAVLFDLHYGRMLGDGVMAAVLPGVWSGAEWPTSLIPLRVWVEWFRKAAFTPPSHPLTVYRGARPRYARGMSWTTDYTRAMWFADRWNRMSGLPTWVYRATVDPSAVLADIDAIEGDGGRRECEIVVDPTAIEIVRDPEYENVENAVPEAWRDS